LSGGGNVPLSGRSENSRCRFEPRAGSRRLVPGWPNAALPPKQMSVSARRCFLHSPREDRAALLCLHERQPAWSLTSLPLRTRTTRLAACGGRLHRPGDPRAGPCDVTGRVTASEGLGLLLRAGKPTAGPHPLRPCPGTIASNTAASSCRLCLCHECDRRPRYCRAIALATYGSSAAVLALAMGDRSVHVVMFA
jgi:hypothetical protein